MIRFGLEGKSELIRHSLLFAPSSSGPLETLQALSSQLDVWLWSRGDYLVAQATEQRADSKFHRPVQTERRLVSFLGHRFSFGSVEQSDDTQVSWEF